MTSISTPVEFLESFPGTPTKIKGIPTYTPFKTLHYTLKTNATSVKTTQGSGINRCLSLVLMTQQYNQVVPPTAPTAPPANSWIDLINPCPHPNVPPNATAGQIKDIMQQHQEHKWLFIECHNIHTALSKQILQSINEIYICSLKQHTAATTTCLVVQSWGIFSRPMASSHHKILHTTTKH